ncbi:MAG: dTMP kinase [Candidatus Daviesbacteria bacterium]|nr:dTMP kinase [Candidatus Daviesbacteria bacterium]
MVEKGKFIVLEGIDNCGKTSQIDLLRDFLNEKGIQTVVSREPGGTEIGEEIRSLLLKDRKELIFPLTQALLFYASRAAFNSQVVLPNINKGVWVLSDRYYLSTEVYQGFVQGVTREILDDLHSRIVVEMNCEPDLYALIDITAQESFRRDGNLDNLGQSLVYEKQGLLFREKLRAGYLDCARSRKNVTVIDGMQDKSKVNQELTALIGGMIRQIKNI